MSAPEYIAGVKRAEAAHKNAWNLPGDFTHRRKGRLEKFLA